MFAAYADQAKELEECDKSAENPDWLQNSSFVPNLVVHQENQNDDKTATNQEKNKSKKKKKHRKKDDEQESTEPVNNVDVEGKVQLNGDFYYVTDTEGNREYAKVPRISGSKCRVEYDFTRMTRPWKKKKFRRFFKKSFDKDADEDESKKPKLTKDNIDTAGFDKRDEHFTGFAQEKELSKITANYNKQLTDEPANVEVWLKYVQFQETIYQFEKSYRKGSIAKAQRVLAERKIAILERALSFNPGTEELLRERLNVAVSTFPSDELQSQLKKLVEKEKDNIILWQGYIEATQCSMSHCNAPAVLSLYSQCLSTLHQLRRITLSEKYIFEENILKMLYQCGLFLKQAGLFEHLWALLKVYLELNLGASNKGLFNIELYFAERELLDLEEVVLKSQLPHHELWLRTEKLRESCHWLPFVGDQECVDPQRLIFNEDVAELVQPITIPENLFRLVATTLTMLKVPLIPCRHSTMQDLGLDYVPWSLDSAESILPIFMNLYPVDVSNENLLRDTQRLAVGPQYLKALPGQEEYLNFLLTLMETCADCLKERDEIAVRVWWFRFQRMLIILDKQGRFKMPNFLKKRIKSKIKDFLKKENHRNNEIFYVEYALIEKELSNAEQCIKILKTALTMNPSTTINTFTWTQSQTNYCFLYRNLIETTIQCDTSNDPKEKVLQLLLKLVLQRNFEKITNGLIMEAESKFKIVTNELMERTMEHLNCVDHFLPDFMTDWIICHGWFLYWNKGPLECGTFIEEILTKLEEKSNSITYQKEVLYEFYCSVLFGYCSDNPGKGMYKILDDVLFRAIKKFPNNLYILAILAKEHSITKSIGVTMWKVQELLLQSGRAFATIFTVIINDLVRLETEKEVLDTVTDHTDMSLSYRNRMLSLFKKITKRDMCTRRCGLVWRLFLQFVHTYFDSTVCRNVYYSAVEECPWLKALYMDAAIYIPAELAQIQDLIIEKQLRLHMTPEELDILRT